MEEENGAMAMNDDEPVRSKKHAGLHRSFLHLSNALRKLHGGGRSNTNIDKSPSSSSSSFLSGCMHPRTHSFASNRRRRRATASSCGREHEDDDDDGALAVDFQSLQLGAAAAVADDEGGGSSSAQDYYTDNGMRGEEEARGAPAAAASVAAVATRGVAVVTFSAAPYEDFRRSMREMVDAARRDNAEATTAESDGEDAADASRSPAVDWDLMEELLFCYLELNDRAVHRDILRAFTDTVAALRRRWRRAVAPKIRRTRRQQRRRAREHDIDGAKAEAVSS